VKLSDLAK